MRFFQKIKNWKTVRGWHIWKLKLVDARLYFVSMIVGLLTGLIAVCYHYLLYFLLHIRSDFFASRPAWYWHILLFLLFWGILMFVSFLVGRMPLISGGGIPQTRGVINGRIPISTRLWSWFPNSLVEFFLWLPDCHWGVRGLLCR